MDNQIIKKSNQFVEALYDASLWEMRLLIKMLSQIHKDDEDFKEYYIDMSEVKKDFGVENDKSAYNRIREAARSLMKKIVTIRRKTEDGTMEEVEIPIITEVTRNMVHKSYIKTSFHPKMKPYLLQLKTEFLSYEAKNVLRLPTPYAIRLYELCRQYQKIGNRRVPINDLKKMLGIEGKYKQYSHLRERVLEPSAESINANTDVIIQYEPVKSGRKVSAIDFMIRKKKEEESSPEVSDDLLKKEFVDRVGVSEKVYYKWLDKHGESHLKARLAYLDKQVAEGRKIDNKAGYLTAIMDKDLTISKKEAKIDISKKVNAILFSRPNIQKQIEAKHGNLSQEAMNAVVRKMFPDKF